MLLTVLTEWIVFHCDLNNSIKVQYLYLIVSKSDWVLQICKH